MGDALAADASDVSGGVFNPPRADFAWRLRRRQDGSKDGFGLKARPIMKDALVAGFPAGEISLRGEAGSEVEIQAGIVLKSQGEAVVAGINEELDLLHHLASNSREEKQFAICDR